MEATKSTQFGNFSDFVNNVNRADRDSLRNYIGNEFTDVRSHGSFCFVEITAQRVTAAFNCISSNAVGADEISRDMLGFIFPQIVVHFTFLLLPIVYSYNIR